MKSKFTSLESAADFVFPKGPDDWVLNPKNVSMMVDGLLKIVKVDRTYDIPYLAGYSTDGTTVYLDKDIDKMMIDNNYVDVDRFFVIHEVVEKALLLWLEKLDLTIKGRYMLTHQLAYLTEIQAVKLAGINTDSYMQFCDKQVEKAAKKTIKNVPKDLDIQPYKDQKDYETIKKMVAALN